MGYRLAYIQIIAPSFSLLNNLILVNAKSIGCKKKLLHLYILYTVLALSLVLDALPYIGVDLWCSY